MRARPSFGREQERSAPCRPSDGDEKEALSRGQSKRDRPRIGDDQPRHRDLMRSDEGGGERKGIPAGLVPWIWARGRLTPEPPLPSCPPNPLHGQGGTAVCGAGLPLPVPPPALHLPSSSPPRNAPYPAFSPTRCTIPQHPSIHHYRQANPRLQYNATHSI